MLCATFTGMIHRVEALIEANKRRGQPGGVLWRITAHGDGRKQPHQWGVHDRYTCSDSQAVEVVAKISCVSWRCACFGGLARLVLHAYSAAKRGRNVE